jgi:aspartate aminotransferase
MIAENIKAIISGSSWIREMFETGARLEAEHGPENVHDFSPGNPRPDPALEFRQAQKATVDETGPMGHVTMPNTDYPHVRKTVADSPAAELQKYISDSDIVMTCSAAGALNIILKTLLNPGDEVITPAPYFVEIDWSINDCLALNKLTRAWQTVV